MQRQLDEIPSRAELAQYQKRFLELYIQVSSKLSETRQFYNLYNILDATKLYLEREVSLLSNIFDNFEKAKATKGNQERFLDTLENMLKSVRELLAKVRRGARLGRAARRDANGLALLMPGGGAVRARRWRRSGTTKRPTATASAKSTCSWSRSSGSTTRPCWTSRRCVVGPADCGGPGRRGLTDRRTRNRHARNHPPGMSQGRDPASQTG